MAYNLIEVWSSPPVTYLQVLQKEGVEFIIAPYEADAQLAFLSLNSVVDAVITEDSDLIVFGCSRVKSFLPQFLTTVDNIQARSKWVGKATDPV